MNKDTFRSFFPILSKEIEGKKLIYFDSACTYLKNKVSFKWEKDYYMNFSCCSWDREPTYLWSLLYEKITNTRNKTLDFIWASKDDIIIFTSSATDSINRLIFSLDEAKIKTLVVSDLEHNSNYLPQKELSKLKNIKFKMFSYKDIINLDVLEKKLKNLKWAFLLSFTHSSNVIWWNFDIRKISDVVHKYGGYLLVDDTQYITYRKENAVMNEIDFLVFSSHKLWGPTGLWILYINNKVKELVKYSSKVWWWTIQKIKDDWIVMYKPLPDFLEWWVQNFMWILWFNEVLRFLIKTNMSNITNHVLSLTKYFLNKFYCLNLWKYLRVVSYEESSLVTLQWINWFNVIDFLQYCNYFIPNYFVAFRTWTFCADVFINKYLNWDKNLMRISFWIYNTRGEIDIFFNILLDYIKKIWKI